MKLYDCTPAPSPRRVRIFAAEKGIDLPLVQVDLMKGEQLTPEFRALNPWCTVPVLVLDDGTAISEINAICRYLEETQPEPALMGRTPVEKALIAMWDHRMEVDGFFAAAEGFRNATPGFKGRAITGRHNYDQIPALAERGKQRVQWFFELLDERLANNQFIAGPAFSVADITAMVTVDFSRWMKVTMPESLTHARRWHAEVSARPSAKA